jgi:hypothetical protein
MILLFIKFSLHYIISNIKQTILIISLNICITKLYLHNKYI